ncbi:MAG: hypothetical protein PVI90_00490 [Desulfobacteraceae bacterium]|jgi:hypothetical protein
MANYHSPRERMALYCQGWRWGASCKVAPANLKNDSDFKEGYRLGRLAYNRMLSDVCKRYGVSSSILRIEGVKRGEITVKVEKCYD